MTGNPSHDEAIVRLISRINMHHGGASILMVEAFIRGLGYLDAGRELRRLRDEGRITLDASGEYYAVETLRAQGLGRWI